MNKNTTKARDEKINKKLCRAAKLINLAMVELKDADVRMVSDAGWCDIMNSCVNLKTASSYIYRALLERTDIELETKK